MDIFVDPFENLSNHRKSCRLCLVLVENERDKFGITEDLKFSISLLQIQFISSKIYSSFICLSCQQNLEYLTSFRDEILEKQQKLAKFLCRIKSSSALVEPFFVKCDQIKVECDIDVDRYNPEIKSDEELIVKLPTKLKQQRLIKIEVEENSKTVEQENLCETLEHQVAHKNRRRSHVDCPQCGKTVLRYLLPTHIDVVHKKKKNFFCDLCGKGFYAKSTIKSHALLHIPKELRERLFKCQFCPKSFYSQRNLRVHETFSHKFDDSQEWKCDCGKQFKNQNVLHRHKYIVHKRQKDSKACEFCGKVIKEWKLKNHIKIYHTEGGRGNFQCSECGKQFDTMWFLTTHQRTHFNPKYSCDEPNCDKKFTIAWQLKNHKKVSHLKLLDFKCDQENCGKIFSKQARLSRHIKVTHEKHREKCPVEGCEFMVGRRDYMKNHLKKHTELRPNIQNSMIETISKMNLV